MRHVSGIGGDASFSLAKHASTDLQALMNTSEAERLIEQLSPVSLQDVGTPRWTAQDQSIQRLNLQVFTVDRGMCVKKGPQEDFVTSSM